MKFIHRENEPLIHKGQKIWNSRSVAVEAILFFHCRADNRWYVPLVHRGNAPDLDSPNMRALPGGYLDRDEDGFDGMRRECREETGLDIQSLQSDYINGLYGKQPFGVNSQPLGKQNIVLWYGLEYIVDVLPLLQPQVVSSEIQDAQWYLVDDALQMGLAFGHEHLIQIRWQDCLKSLQKSLYQVYS